MYAGKNAIANIQTRVRRFMNRMYVQKRPCVSKGRSDLHKKMLLSKNESAFTLFDKLRVTCVDERVGMRMRNRARIRARIRLRLSYEMRSIKMGTNPPSLKLRRINQSEFESES